VQNFVRSVGVEFRKFYNSQRQTEAELRLFKDELRDFKDKTHRHLRKVNKEVEGTLQQARRPWART